MSVSEFVVSAPPPRRPGSSRPRLLTVQHEPDAPAAWFGDWWTAAGIDVDVVRGDLGMTIPGRLEHDGLVVLGGAMGANDDEVHPWLGPVKALIRDAVVREVPFFGICLGHQLAAVALGGRVGRNPGGRIIGLDTVRLTASGHGDRLFTGCGGSRAVHFNDDVVLELPRGAEVLATLPGGHPQAVRFGPRAWGVQFHPEATPEVFASWVEADPPQVPGRAAALVARTAAANADLRATWQVLADRFAAVVRPAISAAGPARRGRAAR
jgi:GMP synthase (glutamine-hydrolysing)